MDVLPNEGLELAPAYRWTPEARAARLAGADNQRAWSVASMIGGGAFVASGVSILAWDVAVLFASLEERAEDAAACADRLGRPLECETRLVMRGLQPSDADEFVTEYQGDQSLYNALLGLGIGLTAGGAIVAVIGAIVFAGSPSAAEIDRSARAGLVLEPIVGPGHVGVRGRL